VPDGSSSEPLILRPVGVVRSGVLERKQMPAWGAPARVEIFPEFASALHRVEKHSHLWVLAWLSQGRDERDVLQVNPRGVTDTGPEGLHGVFAVRSPARPNPIGLTAARVVARDGLRIEFERLDFLNGTPVLDLKPYFSSRDIVFSASNRQVGLPRSREELRESLLEQAVRFHGAPAPDIALSVRIVEHYRVTWFGMAEPPAYQVHAPMARPALVDGLMGTTRVTLGRLSLQLGEDDAVVFGGKVRYGLSSLAGMDWQQVLAAPEDQLFTPTSL
jgi:tRNA (adenine37-N6)-methyltransferase